jgi:acyl carrier protein
MHFLSPLFVLFSSLIGFIAFSIVFRKRTEKSRQARIDKIFANRRTLDEPTFYQKYFQKRGIPMYVVIGVRQVMEEVLDADLGRLTAEDDLTNNLRFFFETDSLADVEIISELEAKFGIKITNEEAEGMTTVASIVDCVWLKEKQKAN